MARLIKKLKKNKIFYKICYYVNTQIMRTFGDISNKKFQKIKKIILPTIKEKFPI